MQTSKTGLGSACGFSIAWSLGEAAASELRVHRRRRRTTMAPSASTPKMAA